MCLAVPFRIKSINGTMAEVELEGVTQEISIALTPQVNIGQWVLVHAGYAIHVVEEAEANETIELLEEMYEAQKNH
ncbi:MAG: HypC/HybG/HupF family hydrogenase formation chaperone [Bacillota bacterium]